MNAERLLQYYETIAEVPDAMTQLRRFVLDLAVRGKLVPQDREDEPAAELLVRIAEEKARLVQAGEIRKPKALPAVDRAPFDLPPCWCWTRVREITSDRGQEIPESAFTYIDVTAINKEVGVVAEPKVLEAIDAPSRARKLAMKGDVIYSCVRPYLLNVAVIETDFEPKPIASTAFAILNGHGLVMPRYIWIVLRSPFMVKCVEETQRGLAYPAINDGDFALLPFPLPPLAEQHRIVAKVDELMALCDQLEAARTAREATRDRLAAASLARLNTPDPETFTDDAHFALDTLPALTARPDQIKQLRQTVLNLAVRGKLVPQDPKDEPAEELLKRIDEELPAEKSNRTTHVFPSLDIPASWRWIRLGKLVSFSDAGWSPKTEDFPRQADEWGVLKVSAVSWDTFRPWENKQVLPGTKPRQQAVVKRGDFLISRANTAQLIARAVIVTEEPIKLMMSDKIVRLLLSEHCCDRYVWIVNNYADFAREYYIIHASGVSPSMKNVSRDVILGLPLPLPPLAEQHRIVARVDELMAVCDQLEASLTAADDTRRKLLDALLADALTSVNAEQLQEAAE
ncbi:restriction endonuclease subunit S [Rhizobium leguminosarum]